MPDSTPVYYHNPRCGKSREGLTLLRERGIEPRIIEYLKTPPDAAELNRILEMLRLEPRQLMRTREPVYKELGLADPALERDALIDAMVHNPILIERPILLIGERAALGRPPENLLGIL